MEENEALTTDEQRWTRMWKARYGVFSGGAEPHTRGAYAPRADDFWPVIRAWPGRRGVTVLIHSQIKWRVGAIRH